MFFLMTIVATGLYRFMEKLRTQKIKDHSVKPNKDEKTRVNSSKKLGCGSFLFSLEILSSGQVFSDKVFSF